MTSAEGVELTPIVFVAGASAEPDRVRWAMEEVLGHGWILAHDWLDDIERADTADRDAPLVLRQEAALTLIDAIERSTAVWVLAPEEPSTGAWAEIGIACMEARFRERSGEDDLVIIVSGPECDACIYASLAVPYGTDGAALNTLARLLSEHDEYEE